MNRLLIFFFLYLVDLQVAYALVDMRNFNFADPWVDIETPSSLSPYIPSISRTYNSRTNHNGIFGYGWCSGYETKLVIRGDFRISKLTCGAGKEVDYFLRSVSQEARVKFRSSLRESMRSVNGEKVDTDMSQIYNSAIDGEGVSPIGFQEGRILSLSSTYVTRGGAEESESITYDGDKFYLRKLGGDTLVYSRSGTLESVKSSQGETIVTFKYENGLPISIEGYGLNHPIRLFFNDHSKIEKITYGASEATYEYETDNLIRVTNGWGNTYIYKYDDSHNVTRITYPDQTTREISYDNNKDWVVGFKYRDGCAEKYETEVSTGTDYITSLKRRCSDKLLTSSTYEFKFDPHDDSRLVSYRQSINGETSEAIYHPYFEDIVVFLKSGNEKDDDYKEERREYDRRGRLSRSDIQAKDRRVIREYNYNLNSIRPNLVRETVWIDQNMNSDEIYKLTYWPNTGLLKEIFRTVGESIQFYWDFSGRIQKMKTKTGAINFQYDKLNGRFVSILSRTGKLHFKEHSEDSGRYQRGDVEGDISQIENTLNELMWTLKIALGEEWSNLAKILQ